MTETGENSDIEEFAGYVPTRHELIRLVKFWYGEDLRYRWRYFILSEVSSSGCRIGRFAWAASTGQERRSGRKQLTKPSKRYGARSRRRDDRAWGIFENGTDEQWKAQWDETSG